VLNGFVIFAMATTHKLSQINENRLSKKKKNPKEIESRVAAQVVGGWMRTLILCFSCGSLGRCTAGVRAHFLLE
jgi:hypothetical protein